MSPPPRTARLTPALILAAGAIAAVAILATAVAESVPPPAQQTQVDTPPRVAPDGR